MAEEKKKKRKPRSKTGMKAMEETAKSLERIRSGNHHAINLSGMRELEAGDNSRYLGLNVEIFNLEDIDLDDPVQVERRLTEVFNIYIKYDQKPTVSGMAMALNGHERRWFWAITHDKPLGGDGFMTRMNKESIAVIKRAYRMMEMMHEQYMYGGKINPVTGIFLAKNNFGYVDKVEHVVTPNAADTSDYSIDDIKSRYADVEVVEPEKLEMSEE